MCLGVTECPPALSPAPVTLTDGVSFLLLVVFLHKSFEQRAWSFCYFLFWGFLSMCHLNKSEFCFPVTHSTFWCGRAGGSVECCGGSGTVSSGPETVDGALRTIPVQAPWPGPESGLLGGQWVTSGLCSCEVSAAEGAAPPKILTAFTPLIKYLDSNGNLMFLLRFYCVLLVIIQHFLWVFYNYGMNYIAGFF